MSTRTDAADGTGAAAERDENDETPPLPSSPDPVERAPGEPSAGAGPSATVVAEGAA